MGTVPDWETAVFPRSSSWRSPDFKGSAFQKDRKLC